MVNVAKGAGSLKQAKADMPKYSKLEKNKKHFNYLYNRTTK